MSVHGGVPFLLSAEKVGAFRLQTRGVRVGGAAREKSLAGNLQRVAPEAWAGKSRESFSSARGPGGMGEGVRLFRGAFMRGSAGGARRNGGGMEWRGWGW